METPPWGHFHAASTSTAQWQVLLLHPAHSTPATRPQPPPLPPPSSPAPGRGGETTETGALCPDLGAIPRPSPPPPEARSKARNERELSMVSPELPYRITTQTQTQVFPGYFPERSSRAVHTQLPEVPSSSAPAAIPPRRFGREQPAQHIPPRQGGLLVAAFRLRAAFGLPILVHRSSPVRYRSQTLSAHPPPRSDGMLRVRDDAGLRSGHSPCCP